MKKKIALFAFLGSFFFVLGTLAQFLFNLVPAFIEFDKAHLGNHTSMVLSSLGRSFLLENKGYKTNTIHSMTLKYLEQKKTSPDIFQVAVFYQDLWSEEKFSINGDLGFSAASLLKVPVLIGYMRASKANPNIVHEKVVFNPKKYLANAHQFIDPPEELVPGKAYPVSMLLTRMATLSDNVATSMLLDIHPELSIPDLLREMGLKVYVNEHSDNIISAAQYSRIFKILYYSEFLDEHLSNLVLDVLRDSRYGSGLEKKLPQGTVVAHKFGERTKGEINQLHDCGIVYHPKRPYVLCVMTRGRGFVQLESVIQDVSEIVYQQTSALW